MPLQTPNSPKIIPQPTLRFCAPVTCYFPTGKRSNKRTRRNFEEEEYLVMCLVKLARGSAEIIKRPASVSVKYPTSLDEVKIVKKDQASEEKSVLTTMDDVKKDQEPNAHTCDVCNKSFTTHQALGGHKGIHRSKSITAVSDVVKKVKSSSGGKGRHECNVCQKTFATGQALGGHMRKHYDGVIVSAKNRSSDGSAAVKKSTSNEDGATISTTRVVRDFDLNVSLTEDDLYCDEVESVAFM